MAHHQDMSAALKRGTMKLAGALLIGTAMSAVAATPAYAQVDNASLRGQITTEPANAPTAVVAVEVNTGYRRSAAISADGSYNLPSLRVGTYRLEVTLPSGMRSTDEFTLTVGQSAVLDFDLGAPAGATTPDSTASAGGDIIVTGTRLRSLQGGEVGKNISQRLIDQLPQINRNFLAFADLAPGVQFIIDGAGNSRLQGGAQASNSVNVFIDGVGQKDYVLKNGVTGQDTTQGNPFPQLAIGEYRVIGSNYKAEFDQVSSVAITAVTKSGTNEFHGEGFVDFTNQSLRDFRPTELFRAAGPLKVKSKDLQFGGALGGPIIKDVMHFFVTYEGKRQFNPRDVTPALDLPVSFFPAKYQDLFGPQTQEFNENLYFGKIDIVPTDRDLLEFTGKYRQEYGEQFNSGIAAFDTRSQTDVIEKRGTGRWQHTADTWINDLKVAYEDVRWSPRPSVDGTANLFSAIVPVVGSPGTTRRGDILRFGAGTNFQDKGQKGWQVQNDFTYTGFQGHSIKVGVKGKWVTLNTTEQNGINPLYYYNVTFGSTNGTFVNDTIPFRVQFAAPNAAGLDPNIRSKNFQFGIYAQDDWDVTDRLTLNLGIRWDYERTPAFLDYVHDPAVVALVTGQTLGTNGQPLYPNLANADYNIRDYISTGSERKAFTGAFQPRLGFSYKLDSDRTLVVFGGYGRSYDRTQFDFLQQEIAQGLFSTRTFNFITGDPNNTCSPPSATCLTFNPVYLTEAGRAQLLAGVPAGGGRELRFINNDLKTPYSDQFSLGIRKQIQLLELEAGYSHIASHDGFAYLLGNRRPDGTFFPPSGNPDSPFGFAPPGYGSIIIGTNGVETRSDSGYFKLAKRYTSASPWSIDATYTFTLAEENRKFGELFSLDFPTVDDYGFHRSTGVRKHRLVMAGTADTPIGVTFAAKFQIASPLFVSQLIGIAGTPPQRSFPVIESKGNGDRWGFRQMDLSATKYLPLGFITDDTRIRVRVDIINLFNDRNYNGFDGLTGKRDFNNFNTDGPPRTIKVSGGFSF